MIRIGPPAPSCAFTVDCEDWYQGIELPLSEWARHPPRLDVGLTAILDLLEEHKVRATFFTLGWIAEHHPASIKEISRRGHELASHGYSHEKVYSLPPEKFRAEVRETKHRLEDLTGSPVVAHRSPFFSVTEASLWALDILVQEGFSVDSSISPIKTWRYGIASCPDEIFRLPNGLVEFPVSAFSFLGRRWALGGAYFRLLPYWVTRRAFASRMRDGHATMFYLHPWEFDPLHPKLAIEWKARLTHYTRLDRTYGFADSLLEDFRFGTVSEVVSAARTASPLRVIDPRILQA